MKKILSVFMILFAIILLAGCNKHTQDDELVVFAASSMTESLTEIAQIYKKQNPDVKLTFNFDSSGTLKTQIEEGAECDVFISASEKPINSLNCILEGTRSDILENKIVLVVPENNPKSIDSFDDLIDHLNKGDIMLAIGNADVPVGEYTLKIFDYYGLSENELNNKGCLAYGTNVKEVTTHVSENMADCGIVYHTDASVANLKVVDTAAFDMCGQVIYPAAVIETSHNIDLAIDFLEFLNDVDASDVFIKYGFTPID